jgi:membrane protease YdiL (CAAX protease family)
MKYVDITICLAGVALLAHWLLRTSLGRRALVDSPPRRNDMPFYLPLIPFFFLFGVVSLIANIVGRLTEDWPDWKNALVDNIILSVGTALTAILILLLARAHFVRKLKGFGLGLGKLARDILSAPLYLLAVWPLIMAAVWLTIQLTQLFSGQEYQLQQHQQLRVVTEYPQLALRILIVFSAVIIGPFFEELLFRGLIQTTVRSFLLEAGFHVWPAIVFSSGFFMIMHPDPGHWPALFVLGMCMGYAYEKSGSLWRPIFIHAIFNGISVIATLSS